MDGALDVQDATRASLERGLGTQYRLLRLLGRGGMGAVYLARDEALERLVAIKVLRTELAPTADGRERFRREARTAAQLSHPNIVPLLSFGEVDGLLYLVMGYVRGEPLSARLRRDGRLEADEVRRVVADVAEALDYAHRKGVIHRDVKPDNILLDDESGRAVLTDFGIAKALAGGQTVTRVGVVVGTPQYMSPEQARGGDTLDGRSDIYSLGVAAYAMLAGRPPFEGGTPQDVLVKRLTAEAPPLAEVAPDVPEDLAAAVMRCLRRDPAARWPDARALREAVSPTSLEADQLPEPLDTLDGTGPFLLPFVLLFGGIALAADFARFAQPRGLEEGLRPGAIHILFLALLAGFLIMQLPILWSAVRVARARGFTWRQIGGAVLRQPEWWVCFWYPRPFRRPGDVWARLPPPIRSWRIIVTALVADLMACFALGVFVTSSTSLAVFRWIEARGGPRADEAMSRATDVIVDTMTLAFVLGLALTVTAAFGAWFMRGQGFDTYTLRRVSRTLIMGCTSQRGPWKKPEVAQVLLPAPSAPRRLEPRTAGEALAALAAAVRRLPTEARALAEGATAAARGLAEEVDAQEAEVARLSRNADAAEGARLREKLAALQESNDPESAAMCELIARQVALLDQMAARLASAQAVRDRLLAPLKALGRAVDELARAPTDAEAARRVRAASAEAEAVLAGRADAVTSAPSESIRRPR